MYLLICLVLLKVLKGIYKLKSMFLITSNESIGNKMSLVIIIIYCV